MTFETRPPMEGVVVSPKSVRAFPRGMVVVELLTLGCPWNVCHLIAATGS